LSGIIIGRFDIEDLIRKPEYKKQTCCASSERQRFRSRIEYSRGYTISILKHIWLYVVIGIGIGAWIHGYVPQDFLARVAGRGNWLAVPAAVLIGIPLYSNAAGVVPLVSALTEKGVAMGTALAFMMAVTALSLPEFFILKKVMKFRLLVIFASVVGLGIILTGYLFNFILR